MRCNYFFLFFGLLLLWGCTEEAEPLSTTPQIEFVAFEPGTEVTAGSILTLVLQYEDGDGDIGENLEGAENLFVKDARLPRASLCLPCERTCARRHRGCHTRAVAHCTEQHSAHRTLRDPRNHKL